jgi:hypothetical protein
MNGRQSRNSGGERLPSNLGKQPIRPRAHTILPRLIQHEQAQTKCSWQEPILHRDFASADGILQRRDVTENEDDDNGEDHARKEEPVLRIFVENGWLLEDTEASSTCGEKVEQLPIRCVSHLSLLRGIVVCLTL